MDDDIAQELEQSDREVAGGFDALGSPLLRGAPPGRASAPAARRAPGEPRRISEPATP